jgi:hypothetical protein
MAWAYVWAMTARAFIPGMKKSTRLVFPAILLFGILPDADLFLEPLGAVHRTFTHSLLFWSIVFVPIFIILRLKSIPYFVAIVQHFAFGDLLMGKAMILWPFSSSFIGFNFGMPSLADVALETVGLLIALGLIAYSGDLKRLFTVNKNNILMIFPLLALIISALFLFFYLSSVCSFLSYILRSNLLVALALGHIVLFIFITISAIQGLRALQPKTKRT